MNPQLIEAKATAPKARLHMLELRRLLGLACQFKTPLVLGLTATVAFACLHTVSVGGAFPIFKLLLEDEGLQGWAHRMVAGGRLGAHFAAAPDGSQVSLLSVSSHGPLYQAGLRAGDHIWDTEGRNASSLLHYLADARAGTNVALETDASLPAEPDVRVHLPRAETHLRLLRWVARVIPASMTENKLRTLSYLMAGLVLLIILGNVFRYVGEVMIAKAILHGMMKLRSDLYERTLQLPMTFFAGRSTSDLVGRFVQDIQEIQRGMLTLLSRFIREPLRAVFILALAFTLDWRLTLTMVVVTPVVVLVFWRIGKSVKKSNRRLLQAYGTMIGALTDTLQSLRIVKAYNAEEHERRRLRAVDLQVLKQQLKLAKLQALISPLTETVAIVAGSFVTLWLASRVLSHELPMANFAALGVTLSVLFDPLRKLSDVYVRVQRATAGAERIFHVIDEPIESEVHRGDVELGPLRSGIEFDGVTFSYPGADTPAVCDVSLSIHKGETIALVGPNGSGKTTLASLLPRLFVADSGQIRYDGVDIRNATLKSLRRQIGLVTQDAVIFGGTPVENIAYGADGEDDGRVHRAARRASADEFIGKIPGAYQASLGERGTTLSGGQRQRLAIARAIFRDAPILIFDEATSQVDSESELKIQTAIQEFAKDRTTLIIAHRLSTILFADRIVVMDGGRIIDSGKHHELFARCELYRGLCETQFLSESTKPSRTSAS